MMCRLRSAPLLLALGCSSLTGFAGEVDADDLRDDLVARRARVLEALGPGSIAVLWSAPIQAYSRDVEYEYRQDSDLLYLTGIDQDSTALVLMPGNQTQREVLFVLPSDPRREHREGHILTKQEATERSGIETVYDSAELEPFVSAMLSGRGYRTPRRPVSHEFDAFFDALEGGRARLHLILEPVPEIGQPLPAPFQFARDVRDRYLGVEIANLRDLISGLRQVKTPYEIDVLRRSVEISAEAHRAAMRAALPGHYEYEVEAALEAVYLRNGAMSWGYPSIVGSGTNATVLHYNRSSRRMEPGDLLLIDAAASYQGLTGDITRTYPVDGTFSDVQRDVYRLALAAQEAGMLAARPGNRTADIEAAVEGVVRRGLLQLGLVADADSEQYRTWYTHGVCHWIGMDVHDVGDYDRPLEPGMTFVIEPGIYVRPQALDQLPDTPENRRFIESVRPAVERYAGIGVRIEDSYLLTESGLERLSASVPRTLEEVEAFLADR